MPTIRDHRRPRGEVGGSDVGGLPSPSITAPTDYVSYEDPYGSYGEEFTTYPWDDTDDWQETQFGQNLDWGKEQFGQDMALQQQMFGFEKPKYDYLSEFQKKQFNFDKQRWEDQKAQFQQDLKFRKDKWREQLKIATAQLKKRPPPVWGI